MISRRVLNPKDVIFYPLNTMRFSNSLAAVKIDFEAFNLIFSLASPIKAFKNVLTSLNELVLSSKMLDCKNFKMSISLRINS